VLEVAEPIMLVVVDVVMLVRGGSNCASVFVVIIVLTVATSMIRWLWM